MTQNLKILIGSIILVGLVCYSCMNVFNTWKFLTNGDEKYWLMSQNSSPNYYIVKYSASCKINQIFEYQNIPKYNGWKIFGFENERLAYIDSMVQLEKEHVSALIQAKALPRKVFYDNSKEGGNRFLLFPFSYYSTRTIMRFSKINENYFEIKGQKRDGFQFVLRGYAIPKPDTVVQLNNIRHLDAEIEELNL